MVLASFTTIRFSLETSHLSYTRNVLNHFLLETSVCQESKKQTTKQKKKTLVTECLCEMKGRVISVVYIFIAHKLYENLSVQDQSNWSWLQRLSLWSLQTNAVNYNYSPHPTMPLLITLNPKVFDSNANTLRFNVSDISRTLFSNPPPIKIAPCQYTKWAFDGVLGSRT